MADLLNKMNEEEAAEYLNQVQNSDPDLYSDIKKYYLTFNDLLEMGEETAGDFWTSPDIDIDVFALSVKGIDEEKTQSIIDIRSASSWYLSSTPTGNPGSDGYFSEGSIANTLSYGFNRSKLCWYVIDPLFQRNSSITPSHLVDDTDQKENNYCNN